MDSLTASKKGYVLDPTNVDKKGNQRTDKNGNYYYYKPVDEKKQIEAGDAVNPSQFMPGTQTPEYPNGKQYGEQAFQILYNKLLAYGIKSTMAKNLVNQYFSLNGKFVPQGYKATKQSGYASLLQPYKPARRRGSSVRIRGRQPLSPHRFAAKRRSPWREAARGISNSVGGLGNPARRS
jgi:hypothetical protein